MVGLLLFLVIALMVSWSSVKAIDTNYGLQKQISTLQQQNDVGQLTNDTLKLQNDYYNTPQYLELAARQDFGLAAPGETELLVPQSVALAHTVVLPQDVSPSAKTAKPKSVVQRHFEAWANFFMHRQASSN